MNQDIEQPPAFASLLIAFLFVGILYGIGFLIDVARPLWGRG